MRYLIIDTEAESAKECHLLGEVLANPGLEQFAHFLSEEETLSKFKEVFEWGCDTRTKNLTVSIKDFGIVCESDKKQEQIDWTELSKTL